MHPDFDSPEAHLSRHPLPPAPEPDRTCPGCEGDGACWCDECEGRADRPHPTCEWCDGAGVYVLRALTAASQAAATLPNRPASTAGGCDDLSAQTPGPAGVEASTMDLFGRMGAR